ncbi:serine protease [Campylobacterota bacterium]|nr:serine protease [Campylobacterota bacterium]
MKQLIFGAVVVFVLIGCGGGGGSNEEEYHGGTDPELFEVGDYNDSAERSPQTRDDPLAVYQWHLDNFGQKAGRPTKATKPLSGAGDLGVTSVWESGTKGAAAASVLAEGGSAITIGIVDSGVDQTHPDLAPNWNESLSWSAKGGKIPYPYDTDPGCAHGTAVAGIAAAKGYDHVGVMGVAPAAKWAGLNVGLGCGGYGGTTAVFANALYLPSRPLDIVSNSWGVSAPTSEPTLRDSIKAGITNGRGGKGTIYVFAAGNSRQDDDTGKEYHDNGNYHGEQNSFYTISVAALASNGTHTSYSNPGANVLVSAFGGDDPYIITTDIVGCGKGWDKRARMKHALNTRCQYTHLMNGTSAATPMVSGVVALMLSKNPNLTWRDVRYILATTATQTGSPVAGSSTDTWKTNDAGKHINHDYGFGAVNAKDAVNTASGFTSLGTLIEVSCTLTGLSGSPIASASTGKGGGSCGGIGKIEFVSAKVKISSAPTSVKADITLSHKGASVVTDSVLAKSNQAINKALFASGFTFGSVRHLDESSSGDWNITITNQSSAEITVEDVNLTIYGRS